MYVNNISLMSDRTEMEQNKQEYLGFRKLCSVGVYLDEVTTYHTFISEQYLFLTVGHGMAW